MKYRHWHRSSRQFVCICLMVLAITQCGKVTDRDVTHDSTITVLCESDDYVLGPARDDSPKFLKLRADPRFKVYHLFAFSEPQAIHWNQAHPLLANPQVRLLEKLTLELESAAQDTLYARINEMLRRDMPVTFLHPVIRTFIAHRRLRGLSTPFRADPLRFMAHLWLEEEN